MSYGLYDADLRFYPIPFYNLELMKLSSFYKRKREIVGLSPDFSPHRYTNFIIRQDFYNPNSQFIRGNNIQYGGRAFDGENYKPLPLEIERMKPDIALYSNVTLPKSKRYKSSISTMKRAEHVRLSLDGKAIWTDYEKQLRHDSNIHGIIFHDYNLNDVEGAAEFIKQMLPEWIAHSQGRRIGMKFPVKVDNQTDLYKWLRIYPMGSYYSLEYHGLLDNSYIPELVEIDNEFHTLKQTSINITNTFTYDELINGGIQQVFRSIINLRSYKLIFPLIYDEARLIDDNWKMVMKLINYYNQHLIARRRTDFYKYTEPYETLYSYCKAAIKNVAVKEPFFNKETMQSIFQFVRENNYELFKDFYEYRGGEVRDDR